MKELSAHVIFTASMLFSQNRKETEIRIFLRFSSTAKVIPSSLKKAIYPASIYLLKVSNGDSRIMKIFEICSNLTIKKPFVLAPLFLTLNRYHTLLQCFHYYFEQVSANLVSPVRFKNHNIVLSQQAFTCSKLTTGTLEQGVKYVQS